ncbi:MAG: hypothetical protein Tsb009_37360 [Planctomycetaceae bacterium]
MKAFAIALGVMFGSVSSVFAQGGAGYYQGGYQGYYYNPIRVLNSEYLRKDLGLTKKQIERIRQINLQMEGVRALQRAEVAKEVGISEDQSKKIKAIYNDYYKRRNEVIKLFRVKEKREEARKKYSEISKEYKTLDGKVLDVLTNSQKRKFEKMKGKPFDRMKLYQRRTPVKKPSI